MPLRLSSRSATTALLLALTLALVPGSVTGQADSASGFWAGLGLGLGFIPDGDDDLALHATGHVAYRNGTNLVMLRGTVASEIFDQGVWDLGVLLGRATGPSGASASIAAGASLVGAEDCPGLLQSGECSTEYGLGIPFVASASVGLGNVAAIGIEVSANFNTVRTFLGGAVVLRVGKL